MAVDADQIAIDLEEAESRIERIALMVERKDEAQAEVTRLTRALKQAKEKLKLATWDLGACITRFRRAKRTKGT